MILTDSVLMIEPIGFEFNQQTSTDNKYQRENKVHNALFQFHQFKTKLIEAGINVRLYSPKDISTPDAVFPNNWISTFPEGRMVIYPMKAENRRLEKRKELIKSLKEDYPFCTDLSKLETSGDFLEGTGSLIIDHENKCAYASLSARTSLPALQQWEKSTGYRIISFSANDENGFPVYHTNVIMTLAEKFAILCSEAIVKDDRERIVAEIKNSGRELITINYEQTRNFCGNCLELLNRKGDHFLIMSDNAYKAFTEEQISTMEKSCKLLHSDISEIESIGGGGVRCMLAELF